MRPFKEMEGSCIDIKKFILCLSIIGSLIIILFQFFHWKAVDILTVFFIPFVWLFVYGFFLVGLVLSIIVAFKSKYWKPIFINLITIIILVTVPFNRLVLEMDFKRNQSARVEIIEKIEKEELKPNVPYNASLIMLPDEYNHLSKGGGEIVVEKQDEDYAVLFFTFRGVLDSFSGFAYSPNGQKPGVNSFNGDFKEIIQIDKNWHMVTSY